MLFLRHSVVSIPGRPGLLTAWAGEAVAAALCVVGSLAAGDKGRPGLDELAAPTDDIEL